MLKTLSLICALVIGILTNQPAHAECTDHNFADADFPESKVTTQSTNGIQSAWYDDATDRYAHGVLGDAIEPSTLVITDNKGCTHSIVLDQAHVFEDLAPRLTDIDGVSGVEVITIRSHRNYGAQIAVYKFADNTLTLATSTPYIGTSNRWLAPIGIADLNNDGDIDIAFVDRPHLAKVLRVWSYHDGELQQVASEAGYSNHKIGEDFISGGIRTCNGKVTMITADARWNRILETTLQDNRLISKDIGAFEGTESLSNALLCE